MSDGLPGGAASPGEERRARPPRRSAVVDSVLWTSLAVLVASAVVDALAVVGLYAALVVPVALAARAGTARWGPLALVGLLLVGSVTALLLDRPSSGGGGELRRLAVLFAGFYLAPLVVSTLAFAREDRGRSGEA